MNFLITGAAGFIGSNFCRMMAQKYPKDNFIGFDALTYAGNLSTLDGLKNVVNFKFVKGDITSENDVDKVLKNYAIDVVVNFAAETHVDRSLDNPLLFLKTNILGTAVLLNKSLEYRIKRFHQVSTDEVYGDLPLDRKDLKFTEEYPLKTSSPYSSSKASADLLVLSYFRSFNAPVTISRCSNNYGPYQLPEKLIPLMIKNAINNKKLPIYGDGLNVRDWLYVEDHCEAIDTIIRNAQKGSVYNVGGNQEMANIDIVKIILDQLGKSYDLIEYVQDRKGHDRRYAIDATKIKKELGWSPKYTFEEAIKKTIDWNLSHKDWVKNVESSNYLEFMKRHYNGGTK